MVTLCYLRRSLQFWSERFNDSVIQEISISEEVKVLFDNLFIILVENASLLPKGFSNTDRRRIADSLGEAGSNYRNTIYEKSFSGRRKPVQVTVLLDFIQLSLSYMDQSIKVNKREDGLYHAYNLISFSDQSLSIRHLYEMLEGQVAVLSSGFLSANESLDVLNSLKWSSLFRRDQYSYLLYPDRQLPLFVNKNNIPSEKVKESKLLSKLVSEKDPSIISTDDLGNYHFNGTFRNASILESAMDQLDPAIYSELVSEEKKQVLEIYEELFDHQSFTGRSGTFYGYEGLGSIYWHMVSKLLLAAQECYFNAIQSGADPVVVGKIKDHYYEIKAGIGLNKSPQLFGAFPTDAYSHTPGNAGAQQPGMTGLVKEDFISRMRELGIHIQNGEIAFQISLLNQNELLNQGSVFEYFDLNGEQQKITLHEGQLGFTFCQVPVLYSASNKNTINITLGNGEMIFIPGHTIGNKLSNRIFQRTGDVVRIEVLFKDFARNSI